MSIVLACCHGNILFPMCHIFFWDEKDEETWIIFKTMAIMLKFGESGIFRI